MNKILFRLLKGPIKDEAIKRIRDPEIQKFIVREINKKIDIPKMDEADEEKYLNDLYDLIENIAVEIIEDL